MCGVWGYMMDDWVRVGYGDKRWMIGCVGGGGYGGIGWMIGCVCGVWGYKMDDWVCVGWGMGI